MDDLSATDKEIVMLNKLAVILYIKELINSFADCTSEELRFIVGLSRLDDEQVCQRMALLTELTNNFLKLFPLYSLPFVPVGMENYMKLNKTAVIPYQLCNV